MDAEGRMLSDLAGRYAIVSELGSGGMATVYLAEDLKHGRKIAIKVLRPDLAASVGSERFLREIEIAARLNHPHILPLFDSGEANGALFYVMPLVEGESLRERLEREGRLPLGETVSITKEIASALSYAHEQGVVHRDVKPANILLTGGGAVVADFGIARAVTMSGGDRLTKTGVAVGTPTYMSPEQAFGDVDIDGRSDVYSLGCVVYEMASGRVPFEASTPQALLAKHAVDTPRSMRTIDPAIPLFIDRAVSRAMAKDPSLRFPTPNGLAETLNSQTVLPRTGRKRLAVLPPTNLTNDHSQEHLIEGVHGALISELQQAGISVISRNSVAQYRGSGTPARTIAAELGVDALIEPSIWWEEDRVEVEVRLVDGESEEYIGDPIVRREPVENVFGLYRNLVRQVGDELQLALSPKARARLAASQPVNPAAYQAYLNGEFHWNTLTEVGLETGLRYFEQALEREPNFAQAHAGVAWIWIARQQMGITPPSEAGPKARDAVDRAVAIDSNLFEVQYAAGALYVWTNWDWAAGERAFQQAIALNQEFADVRAYYAHLLDILGRRAEAQEQMGRAMELDPLKPLVLGLYGQMLACGDQADDAVAFFEEALRTGSDNLVVRDGLEIAYHRKGMHRESLGQMVEKCAMFGLEDLAGELDSTYQRDGYEAARLLAAETMAEFPIFPPMMKSSLYDWAGETDEAIAWIERAIEYRDPNTPYLNVHPISETTRSDPRFREFQRRLNLVVPDQQGV